MHHTSFYLLLNSGVLKGKQEFKFHYGVKRWIQPTDHVIDIGANLGYFAKTFAKLTPKGSLTCIEPIPAFFSVLQKNLSKFPHVRLIHTALGKENGKTTMILPKSNGMVRTGLPHIPTENVRSGDFVEKEVPLTNTRELFATFSKIDYIKCDIEGYEWIVFQELKESIEKHKPTIQIEISHQNVVNLTQFFDELGYIQYGMVDFTLVKDQIPQKEAGDFLFVHTSKEAEFLKRLKK